MATYNGENYLREQLDSILNQSFQDYTLMIRDDNSNDDTWSILVEYQKKFDSINIFKNTTQLGVVANFEKLLTACSSDYIALCDQDDVWHKDKLLKSIELLEKEEKNSPLLFHSDLEVIDEGGKYLSESFFKMRGYAFPKEKNLDIFLGRSGAMGNAMVFNQVLKEKILPFPKALMVHDYWIALVNEFFGKRITYDVPLIKYRLHDKNTSSLFRTKVKKTFLNRDITLPYQNIQRELVLEEFRERFNLNKEENKIIQVFLEYLFFKKSKLYLAFMVCKYDFFRVGLGYKLKLIGAIFWKKR